MCFTLRVSFVLRHVCIRSTGFILEDFPHTADESSALSESGFFPDAAVVLEVDDSDAVARLLPPRLARWRSRRNQVLERRREKIERKRQRRQVAIDRRRAALERESEKRKADRQVLSADLGGSESDWRVSGAVLSAGVMSARRIFLPGGLANSGMQKKVTTFLVVILKTQVFTITTNAQNTLQHF